MGSTTDGVFANDATLKRSLVSHMTLTTPFGAMFKRFPIWITEWKKSLPICKLICIGDYH